MSNIRRFSMNTNQTLVRPLWPNGLPSSRSNNPADLPSKNGAPKRIFPSTVFTIGSASPRKSISNLLCRRSFRSPSLPILFPLRDQLLLQRNSSCTTLTTRATQVIPFQIRFLFPSRRVISESRSVHLRRMH